MPQNKNELVQSLRLDLRNFRTLHQPDEQHAVTALIGIDPDRFWALMESLLDDGYSPTENIIVLANQKQLVVKEGNRRVAALKLILGLQSSSEIPEHLQERIAAVSPEWKSENASVPCAVYSESEKGQVDKLVSRTHAKGEKAGRVNWPAVARARYARDQNNASEPGLDLLEKYLSSGKNLTGQQTERWSGEYPLTILNEALPKLAPIVNLKSSSEVVTQYPGKNKRVVDRILHDIGMLQLGFKELRQNNPFWGGPYGLKPPANEPTTTSAGKGTDGTKANTTTGAAGAKKTPVAYASNDPRSVFVTLRLMKVRGNNRDKVVTLLNEIKKLKLESHPHAFCFLLRSMFEISAKAYCVDHQRSGGPRMKDTNGKDKPLAAVLRDITKHLSTGNTDKEKLKQLHGATTELTKTDGILSVTSMNQLVHHPTFSIAVTDISLLFARVFPLLQEMNS